MLEPDEAVEDVEGEDEEDEDDDDDADADGGDDDDNDGDSNFKSISLTFLRMGGSWHTSDSGSITSMREEFFRFCDRTKKK